MNMLDTINDLRLKSLEELESIFFEIIKAFKDKDLLLETYNFAKSAHASINQVRADGCPYIIHPLRLVLMSIMIYKQYNIPILQGMLLHDVIEDTPITLDIILTRFGQIVHDYVKVLTRERDEYETPNEKHKSKKKKFLKTMQSDFEIRFMKVLDLIDNTSDWPYISVDSPIIKKIPRWLIQLQTMSIPLAKTLGDKYVLPLQTILDLMLKKGYKSVVTDFEA